MEFSSFDGGEDGNNDDDFVVICNIFVIDDDFLFGTIPFDRLHIIKTNNAELRITHKTQYGQNSYRFTKAMNKKSSIKTISNLDKQAKIKVSRK